MATSGAERGGTPVLLARRVRCLRPDWRAAARWLTRVFPEQYGPNAGSRDQVLDESDAEERAP